MTRSEPRDSALSRAVTVFLQAASPGADCNVERVSTRSRPRSFLPAACDVMDVHCNRGIAGRRTPPKCRLSLSSTGSPQAAKARPVKNWPAPNTPGPADSAALPAFAAGTYEATDTPKTPGWDPTARYVLSSPLPHRPPRPQPRRLLRFRPRSRSRTGRSRRHRAPVLPLWRGSPAGGREGVGAAEPHCRGCGPRDQPAQRPL
jgi:hypothetical protein